MHLRQLELEEFRSYHHLTLSLAPQGLRLFGANTSGKTSLLEAIAMLATTRSPRSSIEREVINWTSGADLSYPPFARVRGQAVLQTESVDIEIIVQADPNRAGAVRKQIKLGGRNVRAMDAVGVLKAVVFSPEDVSLISGPPAGRRRYIDLTISQLNGRYLRALSRFNRLLSQRNSLLKSLSRDRVDPASPSAAAQLAFWDGELVAFGSQIMAQRFIAMKRLAELADERYRWLENGTPLELAYRPSFDINAFAGGAVDRDLPAIQAVVARDFEARLNEIRADEIRRGVSLIGPHRDDLTLAAAEIDLATYGSRGQQRLAVVAMKLAEATLMTEVGGEPPLLLLDDVLSELDEAHRSMLVSSVAEIGSQVLLTATDQSLLAATPLQALPQAKVERGGITEVDIAVFSEDCGAL